uniref:Major sperm protein n=1 Tax=Romanomermis culicivorax TaxID=13658 RepID=A0A915IAH8_ROMCU
MAAPGDIISEPGQRVMFNAPFLDKMRVCVRFTNDGARAVAWMLKTNAPSRVSGTPAFGVIQAKQNCKERLMSKNYDTCHKHSEYKVGINWLSAGRRNDAFDEPTRSKNRNSWIYKMAGETPYNRSTYNHLGLGVVGNRILRYRNEHGKRFATK